METYIKDLNLSAEVKAALSWTLQITKVSELEGLNYLTFANKCPKNCNALAIADELNALGYLYPPENEISVNDVPMSKRLQNVLMRNNILYLSQLSTHPKEEILKFRNMGENTMPELDSICEKYGIQIRSLASIKEAFDSCHFPATLHTIFFQNNIFCMDDFKHKNAHDLYAICQRDYALTMKTYYTLKKNGVMFEDWEDKYLFEILPKKKTSLIWQKYEISTVPQLPACNKQQLEEIISAFSELSEFIKL
ncbi:DNA-directed RNA polymerase subunit alpha C-terminal domain-containing protein [Lachnospiraceae bacterium JLR.KK009]|nr:hypothetical protein C810_03973 [Lachnospiraceae bacterium A2]